MNTNPYSELPPTAFWRSAIAKRSMYDIEQLWSPKFNILPTDKVATYGSCFAQHIGKSLKQRGYHWLITEDSPVGLSSVNSKKFNYGVFSSRTGNIYTTSLLKQWIEWSLNKSSSSDEVWVNDGRFYDPFRPKIEPNGFKTECEVTTSRQETMRCFKNSIEKSNYFVFTLGLTESWVNIQTGIEYPMCPGTVAGDYDDQNHKFVNQSFTTIKNNLEKSIELMLEVNPSLKFILTVSPVPLTATMSGKHVLVATMESKSILRAVAGELAASRNDIDYFPSYEIINSPSFKGSFFEPNQRNVNPYGVNFVMESFFKCLNSTYEDKSVHKEQKVESEPSPVNISNDTYCEEELLESFGSIS